MSNTDPNPIGASPEEAPKTLREHGILYFKSLSARLLLLTLLWVSFIVTSIAYTMMLNWQLEASAAAKAAMGELRYHAFRAALVAQPSYDDAAFTEELRISDRQYELLKAGDPWLPLAIPEDPDIRKGFEELETAWRTVIVPVVREAREFRRPVPMQLVESYATDVSRLVAQIDDYREGYLWQLRYLQILLIVLAIGSLFTIMFLLLRWVIRPVERLGEGIKRLSSGNLKARIDVGGEDEIGRIARGFNHMADRLEDLYTNLEQKVAEKTVTVEEKNRHLAQLYEITSFFSQQRPLEELTDGFVERIIRYTEADACLVNLIDVRSDRVHLASSYGVSPEYLQKYAELNYSDSTIDEVLEKNYPIRLRLRASEDEHWQRLAEQGFRTAYCFQVRSSTSDVGIYTLLFRNEPELASQLVQLLESLATHLGVAIANRRLIERDRQFAVVQERQLLAQGLHDSIAQALSFLNLQVQFLDDAIAKKDDQLRDESLNAIRTGVQECYEDVRELLLNFRERIHKEGFVEGVRTVIERFEGQSHVSARLSVNGQGAELTERQKLQAIFIIQEALSNVRKHAQAETVDVRIENGDDLTVSITDDGVGIDDELVQKRKGQHVGLAIMKERASRIGATVKVEKASPIGGTRVTLFLPASARHEEE